MLTQSREHITKPNTVREPVASGWHIALSMTVGLLFVAPGIVHAAGFDARARQYSKAQARALEEADDGERIAEEAIKGQLEAAGMRIKAAVASGGMAEAEAWAAWHAARKEIISVAAETGTIPEDRAAAWLREIHKEELGGRLKEAGGRIRAAAGRGEITEEEAWAAWYQTKEELISEAVELGEITEADAADFQRGLHQAELKERIDAAGERIKAAVVNGEMTEDEGWEAWAAAREELIAEAVEAGEIPAERADEFRRGYEQWAAGQRLKAAVGRGELTEEEAWAAWADYTKGTDQLAATLAAMVERGEITEEQAEARLRAIEDALGVKARTDSLDARTVLRAVKRVDLSRDQRDQIREIEREVIGVYRKIPRRDKPAHHELAEHVKAEITKLLDDDQAEQFKSALERLERRSRQDRHDRRDRTASGVSCEPQAGDPVPEVPDVAVFRCCGEAGSSISHVAFQVDGV